MKKIHFLFFLLNILSISHTYTQVYVNDKINVTDLVKSLEGPGVKIFNINYKGIGNPDSPIGYFRDPSKQIGLGEGLLLTTGSASNAEGPNNSSGKSQNNLNTCKDPDILSLVNFQSLYDLSYIEFDFQTSSTMLSFNYVFASEEYTEFLGYNDVFGFLVSGPGIFAKKNIAVIPGTQIPVSVSNINPGLFNQYYVSNEYFPAYNTQYDGFTKVLTASIKVQPCMTYHIKIAIADAKDRILDSGVFLEKGSFKSENPPNYKVEYQFPKFNYGVEGCNNAKLTLFRNPIFTDSSNLVYQFKIAGTATMGTDYDSIINFIQIPSGKNSASIDFHFRKDDINENSENIMLSIQSMCPDFPDILTITIPIQDVFNYTISDDKMCHYSNVMLNKFPDMSTEITWKESPYLSCLNCLSPMAKPDTLCYFTYTIKDTLSGCSNTDSLKIEVVKLEADFSINFENCYSALDVFFINTTKGGANRFYWNFGDNKHSDEKDPLHQFPFNNSKELLNYDVKLIAQTNYPQCSSEVSKTITITEPLYIPNLITPNNDRINDEFEVQGIGHSCWTLTVYNRWGSQVYQKENYHNNFTGMNLENGTYFYHLQNGPKDRDYKGWIDIVDNAD